MALARMEEQYEKYERSTDKTKEINGTLFYKSVATGMERFFGKDYISVALPYCMFNDGNGWNARIVSENGKVFQLDGPAHYCFIDKVPQWYFRVGYYLIEEYDCAIDEIGEFFTVYPDLNMNDGSKGGS